MNGHGSMNRIFRVVWNATLGVWQVASELARSKGKTKSMRMGPRGLARLGAGGVLVLCHAGALADLPTGGQVTAGTGTIGAATNGSLVINQSSQNMAIDWQSFNVGTGNTVQFIQPSAESMALNRVLGGDPSVIRGTISANGRVVLLNPNGILFGPSSKVEVASLLASTLNMSNEDFMAGKLNLEGDSRNAVVNQGSIQAADGGFVAMIAGRIENVGEIRVRGGEVLMGAGRKVRLDLGGPVRIEVDEAVVDGYIRNGGLVKVDGGAVVMTVKTAGELASLAINNEGIIEASSLERGPGGSIRLTGGGATVLNSGTLAARSADGKGGSIEVTGARVGVLDGSTIDASGAAGGGTILLGGDYQGRNAQVANAQRTFVGGDATIRANATDSGDGGKVIVWSDQRTHFFGTIEAKGGTQGGNGGFVEVSGKDFLDFQGAVDTSAAKGRNGTLLLDPTNLTIGNVNTSPWVSNQSNVFGDFTSDTNPNPAHDFSFLRVDVLLAALANNDITVQSACDTANCVGTITVADAINWNSGRGLTLDATGSIFINAAINSTGAADGRGGDFNAIAASGNIAVNANITTRGGEATNGAGAAGGHVHLNAAGGSVILANHAVIDSGGSDAAVGSNAAGGNAGSITLNSTTGIALNNGDLRALGGAGEGAGIAGAGGRVDLASTTGAITQGAGSEIRARELLLQSGSGAIALNNGSNAVERLAAQSDSGNIHFRNLDSAGLTVTSVGGVDGVSTGGAGSVTLAARNLEIDEDVHTQNGSLTLTANNGGAGEYDGIRLNGTTVSTQGGAISISGRGGNAAEGGQAGVVLANGATIAAGGAGSVSVTATGGSGAAGGNHGLVLEGGGSVDSGGIRAGSGSMAITATGGTAGNDNNAVVFRNHGQIGTSTGHHAVTVTTTAGAGSDSAAYASDAAGGFIGSGSGNLTLQGDTLEAKGEAPVAVHTTGTLTARSVSASFAEPFKLSEFTDSFDINNGTGGLNAVNGLVIGKAGNTAAIEIDQAIDLSGRSVTLTGGNIALNNAVAAHTLSATANGNLSQSVQDGGFTVQSANLNATGDIHLAGIGNSAAALTASAGGTIAYDNGANHLNLNGTLSANTIDLRAASINQTAGALSTTALRVTTTAGAATLNNGNSIGTVAASVTGGDLTVNNGGTSNTMTVGTVLGTEGIHATGNVVFNNMRSMDMAANVNAAAVTINAASGRHIDLGTKTAGKLSLTDADIDRIQAASLTLTTTGNVSNTAAVLAGGVSAMSISAGTGITNGGSGQLGFSHTDGGALTLASTGTAADQGIGTASTALVTVGASELTLSSGRDIRVDARTRAGGSGSADLDRLHITSSSAGENYTYSVLSTATLSLSGSGTAPSWFQPVPKGTYNISLQNSNALDFRFIGNAPIRVSAASNVGPANFLLDSSYNINVAHAITGSSGTITLKANNGSTQTGNFTGVHVGAALQTGSGSIVIDGRGGSGRNAGDAMNNQSNQHGVNVASTITANAGGSITITGHGGSSSSNGSNHDGVVVGANISATNGTIAITGTGGSGNYWGTTSDGVAFTGSAGISNAGGTVSLRGTAGSAYDAHAITQQGTGIITAGGLEVISTSSGRVNLLNNNNVGTLAGDVRTGFAFDNGGNHLAIGTVNGRAGFSATSSSDIGLFDISTLTVNESLEMASGSVHIAADTINIANGKSIGNVASSGTRNVNIALTSRAQQGALGTRNIDVGSSAAGTFAVTADLLEKLYGRNLELLTSGSVSITADTDFTNITQGVTLTANGAISNAGAHHLLLSAAGNQGRVSLNGAGVGTSSNAIRVRGANNIAVSSSSQFNVEAYTDDTHANDLITLRSVDITSTANAANLMYRVHGEGLTYTATGNGSSYAIEANASGDTPVDFSFRGNRAVTVTANSDMKGGNFGAISTNGNVTIDANVDIVSANTTLDASSGSVVLNDGASISTGNATLVADNHVTFNGAAALAATGHAVLRSRNANGTLTTNSGNLSAHSFDIRMDNVGLGSGALNATSTIALNPVTLSRSIQLGGATDGAGLSLTATELGRITASQLTVGRNAQNEQMSGAITLTGAVDLTGRISTLSLNSYNSSVSQSAGANLTVDRLDVSLNSGNITLTQSGNAIRNFSGHTSGSVSLTNTGALDVKGLSSNGQAITVSNSGDLLISSAVNATNGSSGTNAAGGTISLQSTGGKLTVLGNVTSDGHSWNSNSAQTGGAITLRGTSVELGAVQINSRGTYNSTNGGTGGAAGSLTVDASDSSGTITLDGTTINLTGGYGQAAYGAGSHLSFSDTVVLAPLSGSTVRTATINAGGGNVSFAGVQGGAGAGSNLTVNSIRLGTTPSYGNVNFNQAVGTINAIGNLTVSHAQNLTLSQVLASGISLTNQGSTTLNGNLSTSGHSGIFINSNSIAATGVGYTTTGGGNIRLATAGALTLADTSAFNSSGNIDLTATGGITVSGSTLQTAGAGIIFRSATALTSDLTVDTTGAGTVATGGNVEFHSTLNSNGGARDLTIAAGTDGNVLFGGQVGATGQLDAVTIVSAHNVTTSASGFRAASFTQQAGSGTTTLGGATVLDGAVAFTGNALNVNGALTASAVSVNNSGLFAAGAGSTITAAGGFSQTGPGASRLAGSINTTATDIAFSGPVAVNGTVVLGSGNGDIRFGSTLDNAFTAYAGTTTLNAGAGTIVFDAAVGATLAVGNLSVNSNQNVMLPVALTANSLTTNAGGNTVLQAGATITTAQAQTYNDAVTLAGNATLASTGSGNITFAGTIDGAHALAVNTGGTTTFGAAVGSTTALSSLSTDAAGSIAINGGSVTTSGSQVYGENLTLGANTVLTSTAGGAINFGGTVNSAAGTHHTLQVSTAGTTSFAAAVGTTRALGALDISNAHGVLAVNGGQIRTTGNQSYRGSHVVLGGDTIFTSSNAGAITFDGNIDAAICTVASLDVRTQGATVFNGAIGTYRPLWSVITDGAPSANNTVTFNHGTVITIGDQTYGELAILGANTTLTSLGKGTVTFQGPVRAQDDGVQSLTVDTAGDIVFNGAVGDADKRLASFDAGQTTDGAVKINGGGITTTGTQVYRQQIVLGDDTILTGSTGSFGVGIDGQHHDLTLRFQGPTALEGEKFANLHNLASEGPGVTNITGTVSTSGTQTYAGSVVLGSDVTLHSTGHAAQGDITLAGPVDGAHHLHIQTAGTTELAGNVGGTTALAGISTDGPGVTTISGGSVRTTGAQTYGDAVSITADAVLTSTNGGNIRFAGTLDGPSALTINTAGVTRFDGLGGGTTALASLTTDAAGSVEINGGGITTEGAQIYGDAVMLGGDTVLTSTQGGTVRFNGTLDGAHSLAVDTAGSTVFAAAVGGTTALTSLSTDSAGSTTISGGSVRTTGDQHYGDNLVLGSNTTLTSTANGDVVFSGTVDGPHALAIHTGGTTMFDGAVGTSSALSSLSTDEGGSVRINGGDVRTTGSQIYGDALVLGADANLQSTQGGSIELRGTVNGPHQLALNTDGTTRINAGVGGSVALAGLTTGGNGTVHLNGGSVQTTGNQVFNNAVMLGAGTVLDSSNGGEIRFASTLDGAHALEVNSGGTTTFNGKVGGQIALASLSTDADGQAVINGGLVRTTGAQTFNDGVMVGAHTTFSSNGPISFKGTLDGPFDIKVLTPGVTTFGGAVGSIAAIANLSGSSVVGTGGKIRFDGPSITATGSLVFEEEVHVMAPTRVKVGKDALFYGDAKTGKSLLDVTAGGRIQYGRPVDNFKNYLPTLFTVGQEQTVASLPLTEVRTPVSPRLADDSRSRQLSVGNLQLVNLSVQGAAAEIGGAQVQNVSEAAIDQAVGQIVADDKAAMQTYVVVVEGGVREPDEELERGQ